jgi:hypothetical protein
MRGAVAATVLAAAIGVTSGARADGDGVLVRLWEDPQPIAARDLYWGAGSRDRQPRPPFQFVEGNSSGTQPKLVVTDASGARWDVKLGEEVHSEVAASRLVWALGYFVDELYFVPEGVVAGVRDLGRASEHIDEGGRFRDARFERRQEHQTPADRGWSFTANPFLNSRELSGLKILMTLLGNWDVEGERNNRVVDVRAPGHEPHRRFFVGDLGATFGRMGRRMTNHSKWQLEHYRHEGFVDEVDDDSVELDFDGLESEMDTIPLDHARWFAGLLGQLTPTQVRQAFEAAGATPEEVQGFSEIVLARIAQLQSAVGVSAPARAR